MKSRDEWLQEKRTCLGASDVAAILGQNPSYGALHVYAAKVHGYQQSDSKQIIMGRIFEKPAGQIYSIETGRDVLGEVEQETEITYHPEIPWLGSTLDDLTMGNEEYPNPLKDDTTGPLELKNTAGFVNDGGKWKKIRPDEWSERPPIHYQIQLQIQMACMDSQWGSLAALFPGMQIAWTDIEINHRFLNAAYVKLEEFWERIQKRNPPALDELPSTLDVVKAMYPDETGETIELTGEDELRAKEWLTVKDEYGKLGKRKKMLEAEIRAVMGDATFAKIPSIGKSLSLKKQYRKAYTRVVEASEYRVLRPSK